MYSLIMTVFNEAKNIEAFLESYKKQSMYAHEVVIVDGGSTDATCEIIEKFSKENPQLNITLFIDPLMNKKYSNAPISEGRNKAISLSKHKIIVCADAGCTLDCDWLENLTEPYRLNNLTKATGGMYRGLAKNEFSTWYVNNFMPQENDFSNDCFLPSSRNFSFQREVWERVGGYKLGSFAGEDTRFVLDLKLSGFEIIMTDAFVTWECPEDVVSAAAKHREYALGDGYHRQFYLKYCWSAIKLPVIALISIFVKSFEYKFTMSKAIFFGFMKGILKRYER